MQAMERPPYLGAAGALAGSLLVLASPAMAQDGAPSVIVPTGAITVRGHFQAGVNAVQETNLFWNLSDTFASEAQYDPDKRWLEFYAKPGVSFETRGDRPFVVYGKLSAVGSVTRGVDAFEYADQSALSLEEAHLGLRMETAGDGVIDLSAGARELKLGTGMLIANGGASGFELGALKFGPRKAWDMSAIVKVSGGGLAFTGFYLNPNERPELENKNRLFGADLRRDFEGGGFIGGSFIAVTRSGTPYVQAAPGGVGAPTVLPGARDGTNTVNVYARTGRIGGSLENATLAFDGAYQWNDRLDMSAWAGRIQAGYVFATAPWRPSLTYSYQTFSGDDPDTPRLERFDPLFYEGSPSAWSTGSKSSMVFINSNVNAHSLALILQPSVRDTVTLRFSRIRANQLRSPLQFGQASRVDLGFEKGLPNIVAGVTAADLTDDLYLEYNRVLTRNLFLTGGVAASRPGKGITTVVTAGTPDWTGGYVNLVFNF